jgi:CRP/FNR family cyclic AMP-dependent transcriptional regulator
MDLQKRIGTFFSQFPSSRYPKGEIVVSDTDINNQVFYIETGFIIEYHISQSGEMFIVNLYPPGTFFPLCAFCEQPSESGYFETLTPCVIRNTSVRNFADFFLTDRELLIDFTNRLSRSLYYLAGRLGMVASSSAYQRTASALVYLAKNLGRPTGSNGSVIIDFDLTHREIAAWVGTARETASIQMKRLQKKGLVNYDRRKIIINDLDSLVSEAGQD